MASSRLSTQAARRRRRWPMRFSARRAAGVAADVGQQPSADRAVRPSHNWQVLDVEASRIARELRAIGPMTRQALAERCCAHHWRQGNFEAAVRHGIAVGRLQELPFGFLVAGRDASSSRGR